MDRSVDDVIIDFGSFLKTSSTSFPTSSILTDSNTRESQKLSNGLASETLHIFHVKVQCMG